MIKTNQSQIFRILNIAAVIGSFQFLASCAFKFEVTSQRTALENQVLGEYQELEDDLALVSSVRGKNSEKIQSSAQFSKQNQRFNLDDIEELKRNEILGESAMGALVILKKGLGQINSASKFQLKLARILVREENMDRKIIWDHIIMVNKNLSITDLPEIKNTFALQKAKDSQIGYWLQTKSGNWEQKTSE